MRRCSLEIDMGSLGQNWPSPVMAAVVGLMLVVAVGCDVEVHPERNSDDSYRTNAMEMPLNRVILDNVTSFGGDQTDWKFFIVPADGIIKILFNFDNEEAAPTVFLIDEVGRVLSSLEKPEASGPVLRQMSFQAEPANYYLHIQATDGQTDYSVEVVHLVRPK